MNNRDRAEGIGNRVYDQLRREGWTSKEIGDAARTADARLSEKIRSGEIRGRR